jgi:hypothetical protein
MRSLVLCVFALALAGCESASEDIPGKTPLFVTDDCELLFAIGRDQHRLRSTDAPVSVRLNGEDAPWDPACNWAAAGFNAIEVRGPEGEAATRNLDRVSFNRPRYDSEGALVRTATIRSGEISGVLCRVSRKGESWTLDACSPDPKLTEARPPAPNPSDQTPDLAPAALPDGATPPLRGRIPLERDPGQPLPGGPQ